MALRFPKSNQPIADAAGNGTRPWQDYFRNLQSVDVTDQIEAQIQQILAELAESTQPASCHRQRTSSARTR